MPNHAHLAGQRCVPVWEYQVYIRYSVIPTGWRLLWVILVVKVQKIKQSIIFPYIISKQTKMPFFPYFVSDVDHQKADWVSIHERICQLLIPIRTSLPFLLSEKERKHGSEQLVKRQVCTKNPNTAPKCCQ